jgi:hypothetical protein
MTESDDFVVCAGLGADLVVIETGTQSWQSAGQGAEVKT